MRTYSQSSAHRCRARPRARPFWEAVWPFFAKIGAPKEASYKELHNMLAQAHGHASIGKAMSDGKRAASLKRFVDAGGPEGDFNYFHSFPTRG